MSKRRDWHTPLLLTLSLHLMAFTLFINHRLFSIMEEPQVGESATLKAAIAGDDPESTEQENDEGAAPGDPAEEVQPAKDSIAEIMRQVDTPDANPPPAREKPAEPTEIVEPGKHRSLADRLAASASAAGAATLDTPAEQRPSGGAAGSRGKGRRDDGLRRHGGGADTEDAVAMGLRWLASVQDHDGRWDSDAYMTHYLPNADHFQRMGEGVGLGRNDVGISALCMLAFTGAGHDDREGAHSGAVKRARQWLQSRQRVEDGGFGLAQDTLRVTFYGHSLATLALADLFLLTGDESLRTPIQRAVHYLARCQGEGGGWDYPQQYPGDSNWKQPTRNDLSITGWAAMALVAAREGGIDVPVDTLKRLANLLREATRPDGEAIYANEGVRAFHRGMAMLAVSNLCRRLLGEAGDTETQRKQRDRMAAMPPDWDGATEMTGSNMYYWYYGSLALMLNRDQAGGEDRWRQWNIALKKTLLPNQEKHGDRKGSFDPKADYWANNGGGRLYSTAMCVLTLEIYYRYEPELIRAHSADLAPLWSGE